MKLIYKICVLFLINFATDYIKYVAANCVDSYVKKVECDILSGNVAELIGAFNTTASRYKGTEQDITDLRSEVTNACYIGLWYFQCKRELRKIPPCIDSQEENDDPYFANPGTFVKISDVTVQYLCEYTEEIYTRAYNITGGDIKFILTFETKEALDRCIALAVSESFSEIVDTASNCVIQYFDEQRKQHLSDMIRDLVPRWKSFDQCVGCPLLS